MPRLPTVGGTRVDGEVIGTDWDDLTDGTLALPITITQFGVPLDPAGLTDTWSHTAIDGSAVEGNLHRQDRTSNADGDEGDQGSSLVTNTAWTHPGLGVDYLALRRLYCFQQD